jgi:hypothetical protein
MKSYETILDYNKLEEIVIVANTSSYLYNNFQSNQSVIDLSYDFSDQELIQFFYSELNEERSFRNLVNLYAFVVALSLKDSVYVFSFFNNLKHMKDFKWSYELAQYYFFKASYTTITESAIQPTFSIEQSKEDTAEVEKLEF